MAYAALIVGGVGMISSGISAARNRADAKTAAKDAKIEQDKQNALLEKQKASYKAMKFTNPYKNMENVYEDLTVNQQEAQFQSQQGAQQRANIMQSLKGAAGATGAAGLAQSLANQGALQTQRISASIGKQESVNQLAAAKGAGAVQIAEKQGDQMVQQFKADRQTTLLGMQMGQASGANAAAMQAQMNEINAKIAQQTNTANMFGTVAGALASNPNIGGDNNNIFKKA
tara:strand:+ start:189 stop:875 length:687 start_codon:yes stop_codon:yes gene_type:complete